MMSRKPRPASTFFQTLKPFTPLVWQLFITVIVGVSILVFLFNRVYNLDVRIKFPGAPKPLKFHDVSYNMFREILGHGHGLWTACDWPRSSKYLVFIYSVFGCFMMSFFYNSLVFGFLVAVPMEKPYDTAREVLNQVERVHICKGGTDEVYFKTTEQPEHKALYLMANSTKYGGVVKCTAEVHYKQNQAIVEEGAVRILRKQWTPEYKQQFFKQLGRDPFYIGEQVLFNIFTGFPIRKNFALKSQLNSVISRLHAGGFWQKWNDEQFITQIFLTVDEDTPPAPLTPNHIYFPLAVHGIGLIVAALLCLLEMIWHEASKPKLP